MGYATVFGIRPLAGLPLLVIRNTVSQMVPLIEPCRKVTVLETMATRSDAGCAQSRIEASENEHLEEMGRGQETCVIKGALFDKFRKTDDLPRYAHRHASLNGMGERRFVHDY